jgi:hypothetical protein
MSGVKHDLRAARANRVFCTDEKRFRTENTVIVNTKHSMVVLSKIADCARTASRPRNITTLQQPWDDLSRHV